MNKQTQKRYSLIAGLAAGVIVDGYLRATSGNEGNLLVHSVVFLVTTVVVYGIAYAILVIRNKESKS